MLLTMVVCNDMFLLCAMLLFELCLWFFGACSLSVLIEHDFCFFCMYALVELSFVCFLHMLASSMSLLLNMVAWTLFFDLCTFVHAFIVFLLNMICMHNLFKLSFMFVVHACFLGIEHGYMHAFL